MQETNVYTMDPKTVVFDDKYATFNPLHSTEEYEATKANIKMLGQLEPILMYKSTDGKMLCLNGRHRTRICIELGIPVRCTDIDVTSKTEEELIVLCNTNVMSGRDYDSSQKAIQALSLVNNFGMTTDMAAKLMKINRRLVSYAASIKGFGRQDVLDSLMEDKKNRIQLTSMKGPSRSLEIIAKYVKAEGEIENITVNDSERIKWKPDAFIKTELGKAWYYEQIETVRNHRVSSECLELVGKNYAELANLKFQLKDKQSNE